MDLATRYARPSSVDTALGLVFLASALRQRPAPAPDTGPQALFAGRIAAPRTFAQLLTTLREVVDARFHRPDLWRLLDPVITGGSGHLRLECFSSCASVYARVDLADSAFERADFGLPGTTNVDFGTRFVSHLAGLRPTGAADLDVGEDSVRLSSGRGAAVERKVRLPDRWRRGFVQIQAAQRQATPRFALSGSALRRLVDAIPARPLEEMWILPGRSPRLLPRKPRDPQAVALRGAHRLALLRRLLPSVTGAQVYGVESTGGTWWVVDTAHGRLELGLSSRAQHGFSGDGDALRQLDAPVADDKDHIASVVAALNRFDADTLADVLDVAPGQAAGVADALASEGVLGFDRADGVWFHRVLPWARREGARDPRRLKGSRAILEGGGVELLEVARDDGLRADGLVTGATATYRTRVTVDATGYLADGSCTCTWIVKHGLERGPCKHMLALRFAATDA